MNDEKARGDFGRAGEAGPWRGWMRRVNVPKPDSEVKTDAV